MELNYKKFGESGPNIIILHGLLGSLDNWQTIAKKLSEQFIVYTVDQRNHGRSPHSDEIDYQLLSDDIVWFCAQHAIQQAILIGHSMGGKVSMLFALQHPELVEKLIVVDIAPVYYEGGHEEILFAMAEAPLQNYTKREEVDKFLERRISNFGVRQFVLKNLSRDESGAFVWKCNLEALVKNYRALMEFTETEKTYQGETHFIRGEQSGYISKENWEACKKYFPNADLMTIHYAGHWVHADNPESFLETLLTLLK